MGRAVSQKAIGVRAGVGEEAIGVLILGGKGVTQFRAPEERNC